MYLVETKYQYVFPGAKSIEQLKSNVLASELKLSEKELEKIKNIQQKWIE